MKAVALSANTCWYLFNFRTNTIKKLISNGYMVYIISAKDDYVHKLEGLGCTFIELAIKPKSKNPFVDIRTIFHYIKIFREIKVDAVLNFTPKCNIYSTIAASLCNIPSLNNISGLGAVFSSHGIVRIITEALYKFSQKRARVVFFQNKDDMKLFTQLVDFSNDTDVMLLPGSGVDLKRFKQLPYVDKKEGVVFLMSSRLLEEKGVTIYYEAAKRIRNIYPSVNFYLAGFVEKECANAISADDIERWQNEGAIKYLGSTDKIEEFLSMADCFVLPSYYSEGVPKSLLEAAAMGLPIITTDNIGCREVIVHNESGYLCPPRSVKGLFDAMVKFIELKQEDRILMGKRARIKIEQEFNEEVVIEKYITALTNILHKQ
ncbi:TPA: glycosyltransferase family 4 protein [Escherichia coli]|nr:glycosyltransferase family 4 protein [Escherichia coli]HBN7149330.1 glycosyltransferase family 4 protein [Escherichia coli]